MNIFFQKRRISFKTFTFICIRLLINKKMNENMFNQNFFILFFFIFRQLKSIWAHCGVGTIIARHTLRLTEI